MPQRSAPTDCTCKQQWFRSDRGVHKHGGAQYSASMQWNPLKRLMVAIHGADSNLAWGLTCAVDCIRPIAPTHLIGVPGTRVIASTSNGILGNVVATKALPAILNSGIGIPHTTCELLAKPNSQLHRVTEIKKGALVGVGPCINDCLWLLEATNIGSVCESQQGATKVWRNSNALQQSPYALLFGGWYGESKIENQ